MKDIDQRVRGIFNEHRTEILLGYFLVSIFSIYDNFKPA